MMNKNADAEGKSSARVPPSAKYYGNAILIPAPHHVFLHAYIVPGLDDAEGLYSRRV